MDRLIALVALRLRIELRLLLGARSRLMTMVLAVPALAVFSGAAALVAFVLVQFLDRRQPELLLPALSALAAFVGFSWVLTPLLAGVSATQTHDFTRLLHYPVPLPTLVTSSLLANLAQPTVLAQVLPLAAVSLALAGPGIRWALAFAALLLAFAFTLSVGQTLALAFHALSRRRRWHDRALLAGIGLSVTLSLLPFLLLSGAGGWARRLAWQLLERDVFALVPFAWGVRAAVFAGRGEALPFLGWTGVAMLAVAAAVAASAGLANRLYRGELDLGEAPARRGGRAALWLPGAAGAIVEKDLRASWRDPRRKALLFTGILGPLLILAAVWQGITHVPPGLMLSLATLTGIGIMGQNVFALEREGCALLFGFPVPRSSILIAKNLASIVLRLPSLVMLAAATLLISGPTFVPAVVVIVLLTEILASGLDNYVSVLLPIPAPAAGRDPQAPTSGTRGLGAAFVGFAAMLAAAAVSAPFAFLAWLPYLLETLWLWTFTLPLALAGAAAVDFMLIAGAGRLLERREPDLLARVVGEE